MTEILSKPLKDEIIKLIKQVIDDKNKEPDDLRDVIEKADDLEDNYHVIEKDVHGLKKELKELKTKLKDENLKEDIAKVMLELMPEFNTKISLEVSKEMKAHFVTIAEFVIKLFKEKE